MIAVTANVVPGATDAFIRSCERGPLFYNIYSNRPNIGVVAAYQRLYETFAEHVDAICFIHDDVEIFAERWAESVALELADPSVAIVGLGGASSIGDPDIYKTPYRIEQLTRGDYASNQRGWEIHGRRETGARDVAVVDGFFMAVKTSFLKRIGGWSWMQCEFHCYDTAMCLRAAREGMRVRTLGLDCDHFGGGTSTKPEYVEWLRERGRTPEQDHQEPHRWLYAEFRDLLPLRRPL